MVEYNLKEFKEYCLHFYRELNHPYSLQKNIPVNISDLEISLDILDSVLNIESKEKSFRGLKDQFYSAFTNYLKLPRNEIGSLCNSIDKLSTLIDPFLKKVAFYFLPKEKITIKNGKSILLWRTSQYADILEALEVIKVSEIVKKEISYWERQPADLALLRGAFAARHKGVHESRIHNLEELEKIVYGVIGTYIIVCLKILKNASISSQLKEIIEKRRAAYLFEERVRSFSITNTLFSKKEHLLLYRHRNEIRPDMDGKKFLFINYLAGRGPCFFWFRREDKDVMVAWAKEFLSESADDIIKKNAVRFLSENSIYVSLSSLLDTFSYYEEKEELSQYIKQHAKPSDKTTLLSLCNDKREEVALVSRELLTKMFPATDEVLRKIATSKSTSKIRLLRAIIRNRAQEMETNRYRSFPTAKDKAEQLIYIYSLAEVGTDQDLKLLSNWVAAKKRNESLRVACWYSISRIANRLQDQKLVWSLINKKSPIVKIAALEALTRKGIGRNFRLLFSKKFIRFINRFNISSVILGIAVPNDNKIIRSYLSKAKLDYNARDFVLTLCSIGNAGDCDFLLDLFSQYKEKIDFQNHVRVASSMAKLCSLKRLSSLRKWINSKEFWSYILTEQQRPKKRLPIENIDNQAFMRRVVAACFIKKASRTDIDLIYKLLHHYYKWIAYKAAAKLSKIGEIQDIDNLTENLWSLDDEELNNSDPALYGLCLIDKKVHMID